jgi:hypothetical protein
MEVLLSRMQPLGLKNTLWLLLKQLLPMLPTNLPLLIQQGKVRLAQKLLPQPQASLLLPQ